MPCSLPRRTGQVRFGFFPARAAFPGYPAGRRPRLCFRGLLKLHSRYGPQTRSPPKVDSCPEAPTRPVTRPSRSVATMPTDNYRGGFSLHWKSSPLGRADILSPVCPVETPHPQPTTYNPTPWQSPNCPVKTTHNRRKASVANVLSATILECPIVCSTQSVNTAPSRSRLGY